MALSEEARERLVDVVELQPTKNSELQERWDMESGSEVHQFLENEQKEYYYRNEDSLICATPEAVSLVGGPDAEEQTIAVTALQSAILEVIAGPDEESQSVVSVLHDLRDAGHESTVDDVRSALRSLVDKGIVQTIKKTVPTFKLAVERDQIDVETLEDCRRRRHARSGASSFQPRSLASPLVGEQALDTSSRTALDRPAARSPGGRFGFERRTRVAAFAGGRRTLLGPALGNQPRLVGREPEVPAVGAHRVGERAPAALVGALGDFEAFARLPLGVGVLETGRVGLVV